MFFTFWIEKKYLNDGFWQHYVALSLLASNKQKEKDIKVIATDLEIENKIKTNLFSVSQKTAKMIC